MNSKVLTAFALVAMLLILTQPVHATPPPSHETADIELLGSAIFPGDFYDVLYHDGYLYLADGRQSYSGNLKVLDVSVPENPHVVATDAFPLDTVYRLDAQGDLLSVAIHGYGMVLYDISDATNIQQISEMQTDDTINDVVFHGDHHLYVFGEQVGLTILDIADPGDLQVISDGVIPNGNNYAGAVSDNEIVAIPTGSRISFYDVSTPELPVVLSYLTLDQRNFYEVVADGDMFYAGTRSTFLNSGGMAVIDASDSGNIQIIAQHTPFGADFPPHVGMTVDGDLLFYAAGQTGLVTYDISDPATPVTINVLGSGMPWPPAVCNWPVRMAAGDGYVFTIMPDRQEWDTYNNLWVLDNSDPSDPIVVGEYDSPDYTTHVAGMGNFAFMGAEHDGVYAIDISDPLLPEVVGNISFSSFTFPARQLLLEDGLLYTNGGAMALAVIDVSDPGSMDVVTEINTGMHRYTGLDKEGDLLALTGWDAPPMPPGWIELWDVEMPANPQPLGYFELGMRTEAVALHGNFAFVAWADGLGIVAIENPGEMFIINQYDTGILALDVVIDGDLLWFCDELPRLFCIDISQPIAPALISSTTLPEKVVDLELVGDSLYVATHSTVYVADVSDPANPDVVDSVPVAGAMQGIALVDDKLLLSDKYGFHVYSTGMTGVGSLSLNGTLPNDFQISTYPNPFNSSGSVQITLPVQTQLTVDLFNTLGQRTLSLYDGPANAGVLSIPLDASTLSSGVFFVRATAGNGTTAVHRVVLLK
jgi:hypothetical protein